MSDFIQSSKSQNNLNIRMVGLENREHATLLEIFQVSSRTRLEIRKIAGVSGTTLRLRDHFRVTGPSR